MFSQKRRVFLTGASRGIGLSIKNEFEKHGLEVIGPSRSLCDLSSPAGIETYFKQNPTLNCDILINNAGINFPTAVEATDVESWQAALQVNLTAPFLFSKHFSKSMRENKWGRIVNISSIFSLVTKEKRSVYSAAKSALNGFTRTCAVEWARDGVLVNSLCPGYIDTELTRQNNSESDIQKIREAIPMGRLANPSEIAQMVVFLCSDMNTYLTGQCVVVDGGFTLK